MKKLQPFDSFEHCDFCHRLAPEYAYPHPEIKVPGVVFEEGEWAACKECAELHEAGKTEELIQKAMDSPYKPTNPSEETKQRVARDLRFIYPRISKERRNIQH